MNFYQPERIEAIKQIRIDQKVSLHEAVKIYDEQQRLQLTTPRANLTTGQKEEARMKSTSRIVKEALRESRFPLMAGVSSGMVDIVKRAMHVVAHEVQTQEAARWAERCEDLKRRLALFEETR